MNPKHRHTSSGIELPVVLLANQERSGKERTIEAEPEKPGEYPFTRGIHPTMYRERLWTMRQYAGFGSAAETNARFRSLIQAGASGLSVAFDLPTQMGLDPGDPLALGEIGRVGVSIATVSDLDTLFAGIDLRQVSISMTINSTSYILLAMLLELANRRGVNWGELRGTLQNDILKEYIARGTYIYPPQPSMRIVTDVIEFCTRRVSHFNPISISGYHMREAGATAAQELGFTFADAISYVEAAAARGLTIDEIGPRLSFFFNAHNNFFEEIAKFRAARRIWAKITKERWGATDTRAMKLRFHTQTAGSTLTAQQPLNNTARVALQALAAVLGGTQSLHTNSYDEALGLPTEESATLALRAQEIISYESGVTDVVDPLGGSYLVEYLTDELEKRAVEYIREIDRLGGMAQAIEQRYPQSCIEQAAYEAQRRIEQGVDRVVGVNVGVDAQMHEGIGAFRIPEALEQERVAALTEFKRSRSEVRVEDAKGGVREGVRSGKNIVEVALVGLQAGLTLGEISDSLRNIFGEYRDNVTVGSGG